MNDFLRKGLFFGFLSVCTSLGLIALTESVQAGHCSWVHPDACLSPPGTGDLSAELWGEAGRVAYPAAASTMATRNSDRRSLDEFQKQQLRPYFGDLVDRVRVSYNSRMMNEWSALGYEIPLPGEASAAQTYCDRIYIRNDYQARSLAQLTLLAHELVHSQQCDQYGGESKFGYHYFKKYKQANQNYANNELERVAEGLEQRFAEYLRNTPSILSNWGAGAREASRYCTSNGFGAGFPDGEEGIENGSRVVGIHCLNGSSRFSVPSDINLF